MSIDQYSRARINSLSMSKYNVTLYGAAYFPTIGDGNSKPLSGVFATLAAAQAVYPHATALTNEADWCAIQGAVNAANAAGGGTVYLPTGKYLCDQTIVIPACFEASSGITGAQVNIVGDGKAASLITAKGDFGAGSYLMSCGAPTATAANGNGRFGSNTTYIGRCEGFALLSTYTKIVRGQPPMLQGTTTTIGMSGLAWGARRLLRNIYIANFYAGWDLTGDHTMFDDVICENNFYGLYFCNPNAALYGDLTFSKCSFTGAFAGVAAHANAGITAQFNSCYFGTQPIAFVKEAGSGNGVLCSGCSFIRCQFENLGNGMFRDMNAYGSAGTSSTTTNGVTIASGTKVARLVENNFDGFCYFSVNTNSRISSMYWPSSAATVNLGYESIIDVGYLELCRFSFSTMSNWTPGSVSIVNVVQIASSGNPGAVFEGAVDAMLNNCSTATPFLTGTQYGSSAYVKLIKPGFWEGRCFDTQSSAYFPQSAIKGDICETVYGQTSIGGYQIGSPVFGVFMAPCNPGQVAVIATSGTVSVNFGYYSPGSGYVRKTQSVLSATPNTAGSGYAVGDTINVAGGTYTAGAVLTVASLTSGGTGVATVTVKTPGIYSYVPTGAGQLTQSSTSGSGTGANFTGVTNYGKATMASGFSDTVAPMVGVTCIGSGGSASSGTAVATIRLSGFI